MTLTEFLLARIAEDEAVAREAPTDTPPHDQAMEYFYPDDRIGIDPARVLAECEAKRRIVEEFTKEQWVIDQGHRTEWTEAGQAVRETTLRFVAAVYADHPDYCEEWRP